MSQASFVPSSKILNAYARVLVEYALNEGSGLKSGEVVQLAVPDVAKPLALALQNAVLKVGGIPLVRLIATGFEKDFFTLANKQQRTFFPKEYSREKIKMLDHQVSIIADVDPKELKDVDPKKIFEARNAKEQYRKWLFQKRDHGQFTYTIALWGVQAKADEVGLSLKKYWDQIIKACYLDAEDPVAEWKAINKQQKKILNKLDDMEIEYLIVKGEDVDLKVTIGGDRVWEGGSGYNVPSFEIFTSPDWRGIEGWVRYNQPLYRYGNVVRDIELKLEKGHVTQAKARIGNAVLQEMLKTKNADKIGEFSLTDKRMSRITHPMAETLFDENIGGPYGNMHLAIGMAYKANYRGDQSTIDEELWQEMGFNDSAEHSDMVSTTDRTVTAFMADGSSKVIYSDGMFVL